MPFAAVARRWRPIAGVSSAVVPAAVLVHLVAEGLSLGRAGLTIDFVLRHVYLAALVVVSLVTFARTVGVGAGRSEIRRRSALLRAQLGGLRRPLGLVVLVAAYLAFFALTQVDEGLPILGGALWLGLAAGTLGSILAAVLVSLFARAFFTVTIAALDWQPRRAARAAAPRLRRADALPRTASTAFSLFVPNRPPPMHPFHRIIIARCEGISSCSVWFARRIGRQRSLVAPHFS
jgi:hypothetical protein